MMTEHMYGDEIEVHSLLIIDQHTFEGTCLQRSVIYLKPKVTLHCYYIYLFWVLVSGILNVFNSY